MAPTRRERGTRLCQKLSDWLSSTMPAGIGRWDRAWEIVADPSADFMAALVEWEQTGADEAMERTTRAYDQVLRAWERAADEFERREATR